MALGLELPFWLLSQVDVRSDTPGAIRLMMLAFLFYIVSIFYVFRSKPLISKAFTLVVGQMIRAAAGKAMALEELLSLISYLLPAESPKRQQAQAQARGEKVGRLGNRRHRIEIDRANPELRVVVVGLNLEDHADHGSTHPGIAVRKQIDVVIPGEVPQFDSIDLHRTRERQDNPLRSSRCRRVGRRRLYRCGRRIRSHPPSAWDRK